MFRLQKYIYLSIDLPIERLIALKFDPLPRGHPQFSEHSKFAVGKNLVAACELQSNEMARWQFLRRPCRYSRAGSL